MERLDVQKTSLIEDGGMAGNPEGARTPSFVAMDALFRPSDV
ncbi:hypothetical protein [Melittangium boletus]|nr:hypothetical protein [Melittangium boletus]